ncbi:unnamed protein product [Oikopleura dioica]|uniref:Uncharacterized protein n=1 Tax=Oikopleura dioica TaxID=34765 RepID=E4Y8A7_OIKDI|nr:unnamed protein product [Oikopleura dioica]
MRIFSLLSSLISAGISLIGLSRSFRTFSILQLKSACGNSSKELNERFRYTRLLSSGLSLIK